MNNSVRRRRRKTPKYFPPGIVLHAGFADSPDLSVFPGNTFGADNSFVRTIVYQVFWRTLHPYSVAATNLCTNGGFETNTTGWAPQRAALARIITDLKFGKACMTITGDGVGAGFNYARHTKAALA